MSPGEAPSVILEDQPLLERLVACLESLGFRSPKWTYSYNVPINELAACQPQRQMPLMCDVVAYRGGTPVIAFELDGSQHVEEKQQRRDRRKEVILLRHGIRIWRMWNGELVNIEGDASHLFRRDVKAHMYAPWGTLASDWKKLCPQCKKEG
jgi:very-short-patch-repair endonuclease